jgi:hypothetical protein
MATAASALTTQGAVSAKTVRSYVMRTTGPQQYFTQSFATLQTFNISRNIPLNQPLAFLHIQFAGRFTVTTNFTAVSPEFPQNILQSIQLRGTHTSLGSLTPIQMSGASLFALNRIFGIRGNSIFINGVLQPELSSPMGLSNTFFTTTGGAGGTGVYDIIVNYTIPMGPYNVTDAEAIQYLYNAASWGQTLQLQIQTADQTACGTTGVGAFTAFGSTTGSPVINLLTTYASLGPLSNSIAQAVAVRNVYQINSVLQSNSNNVRLQLLQNQRTLNVVVKTGTILASTSAGVQVYATLSDSIIEQAQLYVNNNPIRNLQLNSVSKEFYGMRASTHIPTGYFNTSFIDGFPASHAVSGFKGENLLGGAQFNQNANVIGAAGANSGEVIQDMIYGEPVVAGQS